MRIRERAFSSKVHQLTAQDILITIKRIKPPLLTFVYNTDENEIILVLQNDKIEIPSHQLDSLKKKAIAFAKANVIHDDGRSI